MYCAWYQSISMHSTAIILCWWRVHILKFVYILSFRSVSDRLPISLVFVFCCFVAILMHFKATQLATEQNQQCVKNLWSWLNYLHCLDWCILVIWQGMDWIVELKVDIRMKLQHEEIMYRSLQQNEGNLPFCPILH